MRPGVAVQFHIAHRAASKEGQQRVGVGGRGRREPISAFLRGSAAWPALGRSSRVMASGHVLNKGYFRVSIDLCRLPA
jgi:hypothetical protein